MLVEADDGFLRKGTQTQSSHAEKTRLRRIMATSRDPTIEGKIVNGIRYCDDDNDGIEERQINFVDGSDTAIHASHLKSLVVCTEDMVCCETDWKAAATRSNIRSYRRNGYGPWWLEKRPLPRLRPLCSNMWLVLT
jgi:hypothetical protein